jgi:hypothetical protein
MKFTEMLIKSHWPICWPRWVSWIFGRPSFRHVLAIERALSSKLEDAREAVFNKCVDICQMYKTLFLSSGASPQLMLGEHLKLLPILLLALMKHASPTIFQYFMDFMHESLEIHSIR